MRPGRIGFSYGTSAQSLIETRNRVGGSFKGCSQALDNGGIANPVSHVKSVGHGAIPKSNPFLSSNVRDAGAEYPLALAQKETVQVTVSASQPLALEIRFST